MVPDTAWLTVVDHAEVMGACGLCAVDPVSLQSWVVVRHAHGATVQFAACSACTRAMRRIIAVIGSDASVTGATTVDTMPAPASIPRLRPRPRPRVLSAEVLTAVSEHYVDKDATHYVVRVCGGPRVDGIWVGWVEFVAIGARRVCRTGTETTQPHRDALLYWATGLEPIYLEGAFARTR